MKKIILISLFLFGCSKKEDNSNYISIIKKQDSTILLLNDALDLCEEENQILGSALADE